MMRHIMVLHIQQQNTYILVELLVGGTKIWPVNTSGTRLSCRESTPVSRLPKYSMMLMSSDNSTYCRFSLKILTRNNSF